MLKAHALISTAIVALLLVPGLATADEGGNEEDHTQVQHYEGQAAPNIATALDNLAEVNSRLAALLGGDLSKADLDQVHRMSYTLENALQRIDSDIDEIASKLERVHLASESLDVETVKTSGTDYLDQVDALTRQ